MLVIQLKDHNIIVSEEYNHAEKMGVTVIVVCAVLSLVCTLFILGLLTVSFWRKRNNPSNHFFVRSHAATYFICLLVSDILQSIGTLMNSKWLQSNGVILGGFCSAQGAIKNVGNLGISLWTLVLAIHTFVILFLRWNPRDWALYATLIGVWLLIGFIAMIGPAAIQKVDKGPYFGVSGLWCWITDSYPVERIAMEYMWMLGSAFLSFVFYAATFLRLRGNVYIESGRIKFRRVAASNSWKYVEGRDAIDLELTKVAKGMIGFPVLFTIVVLPIAVTRFVDWSGKPVPVEATIFAASVFSLAGVFDLILFLTTRSLLPEEGFFQGARIAPRPKAYKKTLSEDGVQPYVVSDFFSAHGFNQMDENEPEKRLVTLPPRTQASLGLNHSSSLGPPMIDTTNVGQRPSIQVGGQTPISAWDDIDIGRQIQPAEDNFGERQMSNMPVMGLHSEYESSSSGSAEEEGRRFGGHSRKISSSSTRI